MNKSIIKVAPLAIALFSLIGCNGNKDTYLVVEGLNGAYVGQKIDKSKITAKLVKTDGTVTNVDSNNLEFSKDTFDKRSSNQIVGIKDTKSGISTAISIKVKNVGEVDSGEIYDAFNYLSFGYNKGNLELKSYPEVNPSSEKPSEGADYYNYIRYDNKEYFCFTKVNDNAPYEIKEISSEKASMLSIDEGKTTYKIYNGTFMNDKSTSGVRTNKAYYTDLDDAGHIRAESLYKGWVKDAFNDEGLIIRELKYEPNNEDNPTFYRGKSHYLDDTHDNWYTVDLHFNCGVLKTLSLTTKTLKPTEHSNKKMVYFTYGDEVKYPIEDFFRRDFTIKVSEDKTITDKPEYVTLKVTALDEAKKEMEKLPEKLCKYIEYSIDEDSIKAGYKIRTYEDGTAMLYLGDTKREVTVKVKWMSFDAEKQSGKERKIFVNDNNVFKVKFN